MPTITNARLAIEENLPDGNVRVIVTCQVRFSTVEINLMQIIGVNYRLYCQLWGADPGSDQPLFRSPGFERKNFPADGSGSIVNAMFRANMRSSELNEDDFWPNYGDEIYAQLTLKNTYDTAKVVKNTNELSHRF